MTAKPRIKSKTHRAAAIIGLLGVVEVNFHLLQGLLGEWFGLSFIVVTVVMSVLREMTDGPVG